MAIVPVAAEVTRRISSPVSQLPLLLLSTKMSRPTFQLVLVLVPVQVVPLLLMHMVIRTPRLIDSLRATLRSVIMSLVCPAIRLFLINSVKLGTAMVARMAAIDIVTISSISVNPLCLAMVNSIYLLFLFQIEG